MRWSFLRSLFTRRPQIPVATQRVGQVFPIPEGTSITALDEVVVVLPYEICGPDETLGSVIHGDEDMLMQLDKQHGRILLKMRPGMAITLSKSSQAYVLADDDRPKRFQVKTPSGGA